MSSKLIPRSTPFYCTGPRREFLWAWLAATLLGGLPSTTWALLTGGDPLEATRAAGAMLLPRELETPRLLLAAALVHPLVSLFWALVLWLALPRRHVVLWAMAASAAIAGVDLRLIAPAFFPAVAALDFWPQLADHVAWGVSYGVTLALRTRR